MKLRNIFVSVTLLAAAGHSLAFSLGKVRGGVVLGQPLALSFDVKLDSGEEFPVSCVEASVVQGDNRMDSSRIRVAFSGRGADGVVELSSTQLIEEPAVTVTLRAGCDQKTSRKYVLLTELPTETRSTPAPTPVPALAVVPRASNPVAAPEGAHASDAVAEGRAGTSAPAQPTPQSAMPRSEPAPSVSRPMKAAATVKPQAARSAAPDVKPPAAERQAGKAKGQPRLKLEAPDLSAERIADLRLSPALSVVPQEGASPQRSQALALWLALNASPEQVAADGQRKASLEAQNQSLNAAAKAEHAKVGDLQARLQEAEEARYANPLVYALAALSGLMLLGGAWLWKRRGLPALPKVKGPEKAKNPWWQTGLKPAAAPLSELPAQPEVEPVTAPGPKVGLSDFATLQGDRMAAGGLVSGLQVDLDLSESAFRRLESLGQSESPVASPVAAPRPVPQMPERPTAPVASPMSSEQAPADLFDVQQHAEFFVSLGQYDEAITVLRHHIDQYPSACPLAYLDLLKIHHMLSHTVEYASLREAFNGLFSGEIPVFSAFSKAGKSLESYPRTMAHLEKAWSTPRVLSAVEACLFRSYADTHGETFELDAFKDLLVLQAVAAQLSKDAAVGTPVQARIQAGDLSLAFQAARDAGAAHQATAGQIPAELMPLDPISGFGPSTQMPVQEPALDLDLSEPDPGRPADSGMPVPPSPLTASLTATGELPLHEMPTGLIFESPLDSPLDEKPVEPPAVVVDDEHLIDFDIFEADLKSVQSSNKS